MEQFDDIGPSVVMASPGMMQVCSISVATFQVEIIRAQFPLRECMAS
jgi:hypothetical protein